MQVEQERYGVEITEVVGGFAFSIQPIDPQFLQPEQPLRQHFAQHVRFVAELSAILPSPPRTVLALGG